MTGQPPLDLDLDAAADDAVVYDIVYAPLETPLLAAARARGLDTVDGLDMLIGQAALAFELFFGARAAARRDDAELRGAADVMIDSSSASPARSAWASRPSRRCSTTRACRCSMPTPRCTGCRDRAARWSPRSRRVSRHDRRRRASTAPALGASGARRARRARGARGARPSRRWREARRHFLAAACRRAAGGARHSLAVREGRLTQGRQGRRRLRRRPRCSARARLAPPRHDAGEVRRDPRPPDARRREARARRLRHFDTAVRSTRRARRSAASSLASRAPTGPIGAAMREIVFDTETTGLTPERRPDGRDRLRRAGQPGRDRPHLPRLFQSRARRCRPRREAVHGLSDAFLSDKPFFADAASRNCSIHRRRAADRAQCRVRFRLPQPRAAPAAAGRALVHDADGRHAGHRAQASSRRQAQPRRALHPLRHRSQPPRSSMARCSTPIARPGLCRADRRPADRPRSGRVAVAAVEPISAGASAPVAPMRVRLAAPPARRTVPKNSRATPPSSRGSTIRSGGLRRTV